MIPKCAFAEVGEKCVVAGSNMIERGEGLSTSCVCALSVCCVYSLNETSLATRNKRQRGREIERS